MSDYSVVLSDIATLVVSADATLAYILWALFAIVGCLIAIAFILVILLGRSN